MNTKITTGVILVGAIGTYVDNSLNKPVRGYVAEVLNDNCVNVQTDQGLATNVPIHAAPDEEADPSWGCYFVPELVAAMNEPKSQMSMLVGDQGTYYGPNGALPIRAEVTKVWSDKYVDIAQQDGGTTASVLVVHGEPGPLPAAFVFVPDRKLTAAPAAPAVTGYRQLSDTQVALMNEIKAEGENLGKLIAKLRTMPATPPNGERIGESIDQRWVSIGATDLQRGLMAVVRGVAQPTTF